MAGDISEAAYRGYQNATNCEEEEEEDEDPDEFPLEDPPISPLIIDFEGDGIALTTLAGSQTFFDLTNNNLVERTAWVQAAENGVLDDAFLVLDRNKNGEIDNITELFGNETQNGFDELSRLDSNGDGLITSEDVAFEDLQLWFDLDGDGITDAGELRTLSEMGVESFDLAAMAVDEVNAENPVLFRSVVTLEDGTTRTVDDVFFNNSPGNSQFVVPDDFVYDEDVAFLPQLRATGTLPSLAYAMTLDDELKASVSALAETGSGLTGSEYRAAVTQILFDWAEIEPGRRDGGSSFDGDKLALLEAIFARNYQQISGSNAGLDIPGPNAAHELGVLFENTVDRYVSYFAAATVAGLQQQLLAGVFSGADEATLADIGGQLYQTNYVFLLGLTYDFYGNRLETGLGTSFAESIAAIEAEVDDTEMLGILDFVANVLRGIRVDNFGGRADDFADFLRAELSSLGRETLIEYTIARALTGTQIEGTDGDDAINAEPDALERLVRNAKLDTTVIMPGEGDDTVTGGAGADIYVIMPGEGSDTIIDNAFGNAGGIADGRQTQFVDAQDKVLFVGRSLEDATLSADGVDLLVSFEDGSSVRLVDMLSAPVEETIRDVTTQGRTIGSREQFVFPNLIEELVFDDGVISGFDVLNGLLNTNNDPSLVIGTLGNDETDLVNGTVTVFDPAGSDRYIYDPTETPLDVTIDDSNGFDTLVLTGLTLLDIRVHTQLGDLVITNPANGDVITVTGSEIESFEFADQTVSLASLLSIANLPDGTLVLGTSGADELSGSGSDDTLVGLGGDDRYEIFDGAGFDTIRDTSVDVRFDGLFLDAVQGDSVRLNGFFLEDIAGFADVSDTGAIGTRFINAFTGEDLFFVEGQDFDRDGTVIDSFEFDDGTIVSSTLLGALFGVYSGPTRFDPDGPPPPATIQAPVSNFDVLNVFVGTTGTDVLLGTSLGEGGPIPIPSLQDGFDVLSPFTNFMTIEELNPSPDSQVLIGLTGDDIYIAQSIGIFDPGGPSEPEFLRAPIQTPFASMEDGGEGPIIEGPGDLRASLIIHENGGVDGDGGGEDVLFLQDETFDFDPAQVFSSDLLIYRQGDDMVLSSSFGGATQIIDQFAQSGENRIEIFIDANLEIRDWTELAQDLLTFGTFDDDVLVGFETLLEDGTLFVANDTFDGFDGSDRFEGGRGSDTYLTNPFSGVTTIADFAVTDALYDAGNDADTLVMFSEDPDQLSFTADWVSGTVTISLGSQERVIIEGQLTDDENGIEILEFFGARNGPDRIFDRDAIAAATLTVGTDGADALTGGNAFYSANFDGGLDDDMLTGLGDEDTARFASGDGQDTVIGVETLLFTDVIDTDITVRAEGDDLVIQYTDTDSVRLSGANLPGAAINVTFADGGQLDLADLLALVSISGTSGDDVLNGTDAGDILNGFAGADTITGQAGDDVISGGADNDALSGNAGDDRFIAEIADGSDLIDGGDGSDTYDATMLSDAITVDLDAGTATNGLDVDQLTSIENVVGGLGNDTIIGSSGVNDLSGGRGDDLIDAGAGDDTVSGGRGADNMTGGDGVDTLDYSGSLSGVGIDLTTGAGEGGDAQGDSFSGFENVTGSSYADEIAGDAGDNRLDGGRGDDVLSGGLGDDDLLGGDGNDAISGGRGNDVLSGGSGADSLFGGEGDDALSGDGGGDFLVGGLGSDSYTISGGGTTIISDQGGAAGIDTVTFAEVNVSDLTFIRAGDNLRILDGLSGVAVIEDQFTENGIETFIFADGETLTADQIAALSVAARSTDVVALADVAPNALLGEVSLIDPNALFANDFNPDNDALSLVSVTAIAGGTVELTAEGLIAFSGTEIGAASFEYVVEDASGAQSTAIVTLDVVSPDALFTAAIADTGPSFDEDTTVRFDALAVLDNDFDASGEGLTLLDLRGPDGEPIPVINGQAEYTPVQDFNGEIVLTYRAIDGAGTVITGELTLTVNPVNDAPVIGVLAPVAAIEDVVRVLTTAELLEGITDVDGDVLTVADFVLSAGTVTDLGDGSFALTFPQDVNGELSLSYTVSDGTVDTVVTRLINVAAVNDAPVISGVADLGTTDEDVSLLFSIDDLLAQASDVDGDILSVSDLAVDPAIGTITDLGEGAYRFDPVEDFNANAVIISYSVSDGAISVPATASFDILGVNDAPIVSGPVILDDIAEDNAVTLTTAQLLANATDVDGDMLVISNLSATNGSLTDNGDGTFNFVPDANFNGLVELSYTVSDGEFDVAATASFNVTPVNDAPILSGAVDLGASDEDTDFTFTLADLLSGASDVEGDDLSVTDLTVENATLSIDAEGTVTLTPDADFNGTLTLTYLISDGQARTAQSASLTVTPVNDAPTVGPVIDLGDLLEDGSALFTLSDLLVGAGDVDSETLSIVDLSVNEGTLTENGDGTVTYTPDTDFNGNVVISFGVSDGTVVTPNMATLNVTAVNDGPVAADDDGFVVTAAEGLTLDVATLLANDSDVDGDILSVTSVSGAVNGAVTLVDGQILFTPIGTSGPASFTYTISDGQGGEATATVSLTLDIDDGGPTGPNEIFGTNGRDRLTGTDGQDAIFGLNGNDIIRGLDDDDLLDGGAGRDRLFGGNGDDALIGGYGSDRLIGGLGNDLLTGDAADGGKGYFDRDVFVLGNATRAGNDIITDFDTNNFFGGELNYDTLDFRFMGQRWRLDSVLDILVFANVIEHDGDVDTDAIRDGQDLIFVFDRNSDGHITDSVRLENIIGQDGLNNFWLNLVSVDDLTANDIFIGLEEEGAVTAVSSNIVIETVEISLSSPAETEPALNLNELDELLDMTQFESVTGVNQAAALQGFTEFAESDMPFDNFDDWGDFG